ncbi:MAG: rhodanese-like domain-containing protein [Gammaproteobacteria bacterium]|jgi:rhodanese-related sulfurtransferase|nr:sulfurtransferase [Chromatiales bacterium]MDP6416700.1 rhodanese-like domain-containing protein [Gammaproteobacteria bacterium]MDP6674357.1 rhodanese-like domain-containing protein [Gammaproteobacteria bacterium]
MANKPADWQMPAGDYAGDVTAQNAWDNLATNRNAVLVDVRTKTEWDLIGKPDLASINHEPIYLQWVTLQGVNKNFTRELQAILEERGIAKDVPIYIMCQSGGRSKIAAMQCTELGYKAAYNIAEGFEGSLDEQQHRNSINGWKIAGLPWTQK